MFYLINSDIGYKRIAAIDNHLQSYNWTEDMATPEGGSFEIVLSDGALMNVLEKELFVQNTKGSKLGFITTIQCKKDKGVIREIKIKGNMAEYILTRRHVKTQMQLQGNAKQIITDLITVNVINTKSTILNIPMKLNFIGSIPSDVLEYGFEDGKKVSDALKEICTNLNLFYYFTVDNSELVLNIKSCEDKSYMIFASDDSNLSEVTIYDTIENKANCVVVKGDIINSSVPYSYSVLQGKTGLHVSEDFIDSSDFDSKDVESSLYLKMLQKKGNNKLMSYQIMRLFDSCTIKNKYTYPDEIFLGDVVTVDIDGERQRQRLVSFLHCKNSNNKEEYIFTLAQMPVMLTATDEEYIFEDVPKEDLPEKESDATNPNINPDGTGGGGSSCKHKVVGLVVCTDNDLIHGTLEDLGDDLYKLHIYAYNDNSEYTITNEETGETTTHTQKVPYVGTICIQTPIDILSYIPSETYTVDIDNFDGTKTRINTKSGVKGALYRDKYRTTKLPMVFENPTEENAKENPCYRYTIESENLNFNFSCIISTKAIKDYIPIRDYSTSYPLQLFSMKSNGYKIGDYIKHQIFDPANFVADAGDYIELKTWYAPITHTNNSSAPYAGSEDELQETTFRWTFQQNEKVADKVLSGLPEGIYDFNYVEEQITYYFKKLDWIKQCTEFKNRNLIGTATLGCFRNGTTWASVGLNPYWIIRRDPGLDTIDGLTERDWKIYDRKNATSPNLTTEYYNNTLGICILTQIHKKTGDLRDPATLLEELCSDPTMWTEKKKELEDYYASLESTT